MSTCMPPDMKIRRCRRCKSSFNSAAEFLASMPRLNSDSSTGTSDCASSRVKSFIQPDLVLLRAVQHPANLVFHVVEDLDGAQPSSRDVQNRWAKVLPALKTPWSSRL